MGRGGDDSTSMMHKFLFLVLSLILFPFLACAQGTCPSGANYKAPTTPVVNGALDLVTLSSMGITGCYYVSDAGSGSNNGTSESTPCIYLPGMTNYPASGSCH